MKKKYLVLIFLCFGSSIFTFGTSPVWVWARSAQGIYNDDVNGISQDTYGNIYITGYFSSPTMAFGSAILFNSDSSGKSADIFIAKYDSTGNLLWAKSAGGSGDEKGWGICTDAESNTYVTGAFNSPTLSFGNFGLTNSNTGSADFFIAKYDKTGNLLWAKDFGGPGEECAFGISVDATGDPYVTGYYFSPSMLLDGVVLTNSDVSGKSANIFTAKLSPNGVVLWAQSIGGSGGKNKSRSICTDKRGNCYITGSCSAANNAKDTSRNEKKSFGNASNIFVAKYNTEGKMLWHEITNGSNQDEGGSISTDPDGNAYMTGLFMSATIIFDNITLHNAEPRGKTADFVIAKYNPSGTVIWAKSAGGPEHDWGHCISTDKDGNCYITGGTFSNYMVLGTDTVFNNGGREESSITVAKFDARGNALWAKTPSGSVINGEGRAVTQGLNGIVLLGGCFYSPTLAFNSRLVNTSPLGITCDIFLAKLEERQTTAGKKDLSTERTESPVAPVNKLLTKAVKDSVIRRIEQNVVLVTGGNFTMGCTSEQGGECNSDETPEHKVRISSFSINKYDVTQSEWEVIMGSNPSAFKNCDDCPVENVSWNDAMDFIKKLNKLTGKKYRLPTEAEWEFAARGGDKSRGYKYAGGNELATVAWNDDNSNKTTHTVGEKQYNELGLYDMSGNVWQWCSDWYEANYYTNSPSDNPMGPGKGTCRVARGGSWQFIFTGGCRVALRNWCSPDNRLSNFGFRLARDN